MLSVSEIFETIQGEGIRAGMPCVLVRLAGCNLRCRYCDTPYAVEPGEKRSVGDILSAVARWPWGLVEITGGEPLLQPDTAGLCRELLSLGKTVVVETNGSLDISVLPAGVVRVMDVKCPGSGMSDRFLPANMDALTPGDECKFVVCDRGDFEWARDFVGRHELTQRCAVTFTPAWELVSAGDLADWILASGLKVRLGLQLHKVVWGGDTRR